MCLMVSLIGSWSILAVLFCICRNVLWLAKKCLRQHKSVFLNPFDNSGMFFWQLIICHCLFLSFSFSFIRYPAMTSHCFFHMPTLEDYFVFWLDILVGFFICIINVHCQEIINSSIYDSTIFSHTPWNIVCPLLLKGRMKIKDLSLY